MDEGVGVDLGAFVWRPSQRIQEERIICEWKEPHALQSLEVDNLELARFLVTSTGVAIQCVSKKNAINSSKVNLQVTKVCCAYAVWMEMFPSIYH